MKSFKQFILDAERINESNVVNSNQVIPLHGPGSTLPKGLSIKLLTPEEIKATNNPPELNNTNTRNTTTTTKTKPKPDPIRDFIKSISGSNATFPIIGL